jgi:hypothetical protein
MPDTCKVESLGYVCARAAMPGHTFHWDPDGDWWMLYPQNEQQWGDPSMFPPTGYILLHDPMLPLLIKG